MRARMAMGRRGFGLGGGWLGENVGERGSWCAARWVHFSLHASAWTSTISSSKTTLQALAIYALASYVATD